MKKLDKLKIEKSIAEKFQFMPPQMAKAIKLYYEREIKAIESYGAENPDVETLSLAWISGITFTATKEDSDGDTKAN